MESDNHVILEVDNTRNEAYLIFPEHLNENTVLPEPAEVTAPELRVDFNNVTHINSSGILQWLKWSQQLMEQTSDLSVIFENCREVVVDQINRIEGMRPPGTTVASFYLPYYCEDCDRKEEVCLVTDHAINQSGELASANPQCSQCGEAMEEDVLLQGYLRFLKE